MTDLSIEHESFPAESAREAQDAVVAVFGTVGSGLWPSGIPVSFPQERLWLAHQVARDPSVYNIGLAFRIRGGIRVEALDSALVAIVNRHEVLRTGIIAPHGKPLQHIYEAPKRILQCRQTGFLAQQELFARIREVIVQPFELTQGEVCRAVLMELEPSDHVFVFAVHHIASDGASLGIFLQELRDAYNSAIQGTSIHYTPLPLRYADWAIKQRSSDEKATLSEALLYWKSALEGAPQSFDFGPEGPGLSEVSTKASFVLNEEVTGAVHALARKYRATPFMVLLTCWNTLLFRYTGQNDILMVSPVSGRGTPELENLIGVFVNLLPLRTRVRGDQPFGELLQQVRSTCRGAYAYQNIPFEIVMEQASCNRSSGQPPSIRLLISHQEHESARLELSDLHTDRIEAGRQSVEFDLSMYLQEQSGRLCCEVEASARVAACLPLRHLAEHFEYLVRSACDSPECAVGELPWLNAREVKHLMSFGAGEKVARYSGVIHCAFEEQAALTPDAIAIVFHSERWTYARLNMEADGLALHLMSRLRSTNSVVGVCVERSPRMIVALLAVLKAGAAYVPIDPHLPDARIEYMVRDSGIEYVISQASLTSAFTARGVKVIDVETIATSGEGSTTLPGVAAGDLAYVIYTSGSTGRPKGVMITHGALGNLLAAMRHMLRVTASDTITALTTLSFDIAALELFMPLLAGGCVWMVSGSMMEDGRRLAETLRDSSVGLIQGTPSTWRMLLESGWQPASRGLRALCGGEALDRELADRLLRTGVELWNVYGPTETTVWSTAAIVSPEDVCFSSGSVPIGRPISNTQCYVLDQRLDLCPEGVLGELYIAGDGVSQGYIGQPALTAERFRPNPFTQEPGGRIYGTGDLVRLSIAQGIEFIGRRDTQVKIRGHRIELSEVEAALTSHPAVLEAAAIVVRGAAGQLMLVAHVVVRPGKERPSIESLRSWLNTMLPPYMTPSGWVWHDALPLTTSRKIDRQALSLMEAHSYSNKVVLPRTKQEKEMADIWADVLHVEHVGIHDNFFELGGDSILAIQMAAQATERGMKFMAREILERQTIASLMEGAPTAQMDVIERGQRTRAPLSLPQRRMWLLAQLGGDQAAYIILLVLRFRGLLDIDALRSALTEMMRRHEILRTSYAVEAGEPIQIVGPAVDFPLIIEQLADLEAGVQEQYILQRASEESIRPFRFDVSPMVRGVLLNFNAQENALVFATHHIAADGWSMRVLARELVELYEQYRLGQPSLLPEPDIQYSDYSLWQREWLLSESMRGQIDYWRKELAGVPVLELPCDKPRLPIRSMRGDEVFLDLEPELMRELHAFAKRERVTLFMLLLAGFELLMWRYSGQTDFAVAVPVAGRTRPESQNVVGMFVNTLGLRARIESNLTVQQFLSGVKQLCLKAFENDEAPFEQLVDELQKSRDSGHSPIAQVMFFAEDQEVPALGRLHDLEVKLFRVPRPWSILDLSVLVIDGLHPKCRFEYSRDLFEEERVAGMVGHYVRVLEWMVCHGGERISELELLDSGERSRAVEGWNRTEVDYGAAVSLHGWIEEQAERSPEAVAVEFGGERISYGELMRRSGVLAAGLRGKGVRAETAVGICCERSIELVVGLLGILRAGGAYVPLGGEYPAERLRWMVEDAGIGIVLTQGEQAERVRGLGVEVVELEEVGGWSVEGQQSWGVEPESAAYIIYTSGSTGRPKGVVNTHGGIVNRLRWMQSAFGLEAGEGVLQKTPYSFDVSVWELFWALGVGGRVVLARPGGHRDPVYLSAAIEEHGITTVHFVPSMLEAFLGGGDLERCVGLKRVICSGEALSGVLEGEFRGRLGAELHNLYGPTEAAVDVSWWACVGEPRSEGTPIGRPIGNVRLYVLDGRMEPCPVGVSGELYIGGAGLARGYVGRAGLTGEKFVPDPHGERGGGRLYRTGDAARYRGDGAIEYIGRLDDQVKVRGFRIELGEIEAVLRGQLGVRGAAVVVRGEGGNRWLAAYVTGERMEAAHLRTELRRQLPEYMIPATFTWLEQLPVTANGKLDRRALPEADNSAEAQREYVAPRTEQEQSMAAIWADVLRVDRVGLHDNFFQLGGHSLLLIRLASRIQEEFGLDVPLGILFDHPTIAALMIAIVKMVLEEDAESEAIFAEIQALSQDDAVRLLQAANAE